MKSKLIISFILFLGLISVCLSCSCSPEQHPQLIYCDDRTQYAIKAVVVSQKLVNFNYETGQIHAASPASSRNDYHRAYYVARELKVRVLKTYKGNISEHEYVKIYTGRDDGVCGTSVEDGHYYFLMGSLDDFGKLRHSTCNYKEEITHSTYLTTRLIAENFLRNWKRGCGKCYITTPMIYKMKCSGSRLCTNLSYSVPNKRGRCKFYEYNMIDMLLEKRGGRGRYNIVHIPKKQDPNSIIP